MFIVIMFAYFEFCHRAVGVEEKERQVKGYSSEESMLKVARNETATTLRDCLHLFSSI